MINLKSSAAVIIALASLLSACGSGGGNTVNETSEDTGDTRFQAVQAHSAFSALVQKIDCDPVKKSASAYVYQARVNRRVYDNPGSWRTYNDLVRVVIDPRTRMLRATISGTYSMMNYSFASDTNAYTVSPQKMEIRNFGTITVDRDGTSLIVETQGAENPEPLVKSRVPLTTADDKLDYSTFCRP